MDLKLPWQGQRLPVIFMLLCIDCFFLFVCFSFQVGGVDRSQGCHLIFLDFSSHVVICYKKDKWCQPLLMRWHSSLAGRYCIGGHWTIHMSLLIQYDLCHLACFGEMADLDCVKSVAVQWLNGFPPTKLKAPVGSQYNL